MEVLSMCPCGQIPSALDLQENGQGGKYMLASPNCCGEWAIEFRANYTKGEEAMKLAISAWNAMPRGVMK